MSAPQAPQGAQLAWLYGKRDSNLLVFVTREPDGLHYVWVRGALEAKPTWTYAFKSKKKALSQMRTTAGYARASSLRSRTPASDPGRRARAARPRTRRDPQGALQEVLVRARMQADHSRRELHVVPDGGGWIVSERPARGGMTIYPRREEDMPNVYPKWEKTRRASDPARAASPASSLPRSGVSLMAYEDAVSREMKGLPEHFLHRPGSVAAEARLLVLQGWRAGWSPVVTALRIERLARESGKFRVRDPGRRVRKQNRSRRP